MTWLLIFAIIKTQEKLFMANEYEFIVYMAILVGVSYTSFKLGVTEGIQDTIHFFHEKGVIQLDDEE